MSLSREKFESEEGRKRLVPVKRKGARPRVQTVSTMKDKTKQSQAKHCDLNALMDKATRRNTLMHFGRYQPRYGEITGASLQDALNVVAEAETMFEDLPSEMRKKFKNNPVVFHDFVCDEKNREELYTMGLAKRPERPEPVSVRFVDAEGNDVSLGGEEPPPSEA